ncbi:tellurium resistance TerZ family protein [Enterobacter mori]|uniref:TerD family protein n=1 Tax=Enterobacter mori TaxID=539813 RepID=UPI001EE40DA1|nr:TerD family protein [Enterobacter mori]MCG5128872.1 tellurium resistance TerZ family protein [Enterobacter mori]
MVSLSKNQTVSLSKECSSLNQIQIGLGWDPIKKKGFLSGLLGGNDSIDLDAGCILMDSIGNKVDTIWFRKLKSTCGAVVHSGDNLTGEGDGDDEVINVSLSRLPANVEYLAFTVNSFRGQSFNDVENAFCRVVDQTGRELAHYKLAEQGAHTGIVIASLRRNNGNWDFTAHGHACRGRTIDDMNSDIVSTVIR